MTKSERPIEEENRLEREKRLAKIRDRARIFREVLANPRGKLFLELLTESFKMQTRYPPNILDDHGRSDPIQTARKAGHYDVLGFIQDQLEFKESDYGNPSDTGTQ